MKLAYPKENTPADRTWLFRVREDVAEALIDLYNKPGEYVDLVCPTKSVAKNLQRHIFGFCRAFYSYLPFVTSIRNESDEWFVRVTKPSSKIRIRRRNAEEDKSGKA
jgi:hypothetical protein